MGMRTRIVWVSLLGAACLLAVLFNANLVAEPTPQQRKETAMAGPGADESLTRARMDGKYQMLLHQIEVPKDKETYPILTDLGYQERRDYAGHKNLSPGWWVYSAPYWFVWRDLKS